MRDKTGRRSAPVGPSPAVQNTPLRSRTRISGFKPHNKLRFQKTCPGGSLWSGLFRRRPCGRDPKRPATKGGKGAESRDLLETRRLPPLKARGSRESSHGRRRKRPDQLDRFFENADSNGELHLQTSGKTCQAASKSAPFRHSPRVGKGAWGR